MQKEFVLYEEAKALKELGFDEPCFAYYHDKRLSGVNKWDRLDFEFHVISKKEITNTVHEIILTPTYSQAFRWFRKNYPNLDFGVGKIYDGSNTNYHYHINLIWEYFVGTYEEAELACIVKLIEIVKKQNLKK